MKKLYSLLAIAALGFSANAQIVINEVYGGGANADGMYINDYVELANIGTTTETLKGATLQYASATGNFGTYSSLPEISLLPGQKYLIEMVPSKANTAGAALPTADYQMTSNTSFSNSNVYTGGFNISATTGKVALAKDATQVTTAGGSNVLDLVGFGSTATIYEGTGPAPTITSTTSATRNGTDTNDNAKDFTKATPTPQNMASLATAELNGKKVNFVKNTMVDNAILFGAKSEVKIYNANGQLVKSASVKDGSSVDVSSLAKGLYIVTGEVDGQKVSQKVIKK